MTEQTVTVKLSMPVEIGNDLIEEIVLRRPKGKDLKLSIKGKSDFEDSISLAVRLSGQLPVVFDEMDGADLSAVLDEVGNFMKRGQ